MSGAKFRTLPSKEIHLLRNSGNTVHASCTFDFLGEDGITSLNSNVSFQAQRADNPADTWSDIIDLNATARTISVSSGSTTKNGRVLVRVEYDDFQDVIEVVVHESISDIHIAHNNFTLYKGLGRRLVAVFAEFDDGSGATSFGEISANSHLLSYTSKHLSDVSIDSYGVVECLDNVNTDNELTVFGTFSSTTFTKKLNVTIKDIDGVTASSTLPELEAQMIGSFGADRSLTMVFFPIGFQDDGNGANAKFEGVTNQLAAQMSTGHRHLRYALKDNVNFYRVPYYQQDDGVNVVFGPLN